jgi:two-component system, LytTR family, sensor kinase
VAESILVSAVTATRRLKPWMIVALAWIIPALLGAVDNIGQHAVWGGTTRGREVLFTALDWLIYGLFTPAIFALSKRWPLTTATLGRNLWRHLLLSLVFCVAWASCGMILRLLLDPQMRGNPTEAVHWYAGWILTTLPFGASVYLAMVGIEHGIRSFAEARARETQVTRLSEQLASAKLATLQSQMNPHFLFNSLNTVAVLVRDEETKRATAVIEHLSDVLRRTLSRTRASEVSLEEELDLVRDYLAVEQARFSDRLRIEIDVDPSLLGAAIPGFALQHLVENAIRHGISRRTEAGLVRIVAHRVDEMLEVIVTDDGAGIQGDVTSPGHGLANTRERLRTLYGERAILDVSAAGAGAGTIARLRIPYHELVRETVPDADS